MNVSSLSRDNLVQSLRDQGFTVRVTHHRNYLVLNTMVYNGCVRPSNNLVSVVTLPRHMAPPLNMALPKGGMTEVEVVTPDGEILTDTAYCSETDQFNKRRGVAIALGRILKELQKQ